MLNVRTDFNAVGDGIADDTAAIASALAAGAATEAAVQFPAGTYRTTAGLVVNPYRTPLVCDGPQATVFKPELAAGEYAFTFGWDPALETSTKRGPFTALSGVCIELPQGAGQANAIRIDGQGSTGSAHSMTFRDVSIVGGEVQVDLQDYVYLTRFERCFFNYANGYGVRLDNPNVTGENISFDSCVFAGGPGTGVYANKSGASLYFNHCSFDYLARAVWQRAGVTTFVSCHFETGEVNGTGAEFVLLDRRGYIDKPAMSLIGCDFYTIPSSYDTLIRCKGDHGDQALRVLYPYVKLAAPTVPACPYLVRDDGPSPSSIVVDAPWYVRSDTPPLKLRKQDGADVVLTSGDRVKV